MIYWIVGVGIAFGVVTGLLAIKIKKLEKHRISLNEWDTMVDRRVKRDFGYEARNHEYMMIVYNKDGKAHVNRYETLPKSFFCETPETVHLKIDELFELILRNYDMDIIDLDKERGKIDKLKLKVKK